MPKPCSICKHPHRLTIEAQLQTCSLRYVANLYTFSKDALHRHIKAGHLLPLDELKARRAEHWKQVRKSVQDV